LSAPNKTFALLLTLAYLLLAGAITARHEIWRDEAQAFLIAKDSSTIPDLLSRVKNDVHPPFWHLLLFLVTRLTSSPWGMQALHLLIASAVVYLFARYSPFPRLPKILFALSYYALFEYGVIARNYSLGILFLFLFCALFPQRKKRPLLLAAVLVLLALTSVHALILAAALTLGLLADRWSDGSSGRRPVFWLSIGLILAGIVLSIFLALPPSESIYAKTPVLFFNPSHILNVVRTIPKAYFSLPQPGLHFWNTSLLNNLPATPITIHLLIVLLIVYSLLLFLEQRTALVFFILATSALAAFFYLAYFGFIRHHGFFFFVFLASLWITSSSDARPVRRPRLHALSVFCRKISPAVLSLLLGCQALAGLYAAAMDFRYAFSQGRATAAFIRSHRLEDRILVADIDFAMASLSAYLNRPLYYPRGERWGTYQLYVHSPRRVTDMGHIVAAAERLSRESEKDYLLILNYPLNDLSLVSRSLRTVAKSGEAIVREESFFLYQKARRTSPEKDGTQEAARK
jgi:hypothetical protein